jgi:hypothetical protein
LYVFCFLVAVYLYLFIYLYIYILYSLDLYPGYSDFLGYPAMLAHLPQYLTVRLALWESGMQSIT